MRRRIGALVWELNTFSNQRYAYRSLSSPGTLENNSSDSCQYRPAAGRRREDSPAVCHHNDSLGCPPRIRGKRVSSKQKGRDVLHVHGMCCHDSIGYSNSFFFLFFYAVLSAFYGFRGLLSSLNLTRRTAAPQPTSKNVLSFKRLSKALNPPSHVYLLPVVILLEHEVIERNFLTFHSMNFSCKFVSTILTASFVALL